MVVDPITRTLVDIQQRLAGDERGELADYIPQLATADPQLFGIALASLDGRIYQAGDALAQFTIQSVSKPFVHAGRWLIAGLRQSSPALERNRAANRSTPPVWIRRRAAR